MASLRETVAAWLERGQIVNDAGMEDSDPRWNLTFVGSDIDAEELGEVASAYAATISDEFIDLAIDDPDEARRLALFAFSHGVVVGALFANNGH